MQTKYQPSKVGLNELKRPHEGAESKKAFWFWKSSGISIENRYCFPSWDWDGYARPGTSPSVCPLKMIRIFWEYIPLIQNTPKTPVVFFW